MKKTQKIETSIFPKYRSALSNKQPKQHESNYKGSGVPKLEDSIRIAEISKKGTSTSHFT